MIKDFESRVCGGGYQGFVGSGVRGLRFRAHGCRTQNLGLGGLESRLRIMPHFLQSNIMEALKQMCWIPKVGPTLSDVFPGVHVHLEPNKCSYLFCSPNVRAYNNEWFSHKRLQ